MVSVSTIRLAPPLSFGMLPEKMHRFWGRAVAVGGLVAVAACGGSVDRKDQRPGTATGTDGGVSDGGFGGSSGHSGAGAVGGSGGDGAGGGTGGRVFVDPGCPDTPPPDAIEECDPFAPVSGCPFGERCIPTVDYADDCGTEVFGTECVAAGTGTQGDDCTVDPCAERFVCVTTGEGSQCVRLCTIENASDDCPPGFLCQSLDVDGFYICF